MGALAFILGFALMYFGAISRPAVIRVPLVFIGFAVTASAPVLLFIDIFKP